jgi:hypothetical protein
VQERYRRVSILHTFCGQNCAQAYPMPSSALISKGKVFVHICWACDTFSTTGGMVGRKALLCTQTVENFVRKAAQRGLSG